MSMRRLVMVVAGFLFGLLLAAGNVRAACTGSWSWVSDNGYTGVLGPGQPAAVVSAYLATWGGNLTSPVVVASNGATFTFGAGHGSYTEYTYTFTGSSCTADPPASAPSGAAGGMGSYSENAGLYVFVVGLVLAFGLGVIAGGRR